MVDDDVGRSAEDFRQTAARLRQLAELTRSREARASLLDLAERFERLAAQLDPEQPPPATPP